MAKKLNNPKTAKTDNSDVTELFKARDSLLKGNSITEVTAKTGLPEIVITTLRTSMIVNLELIKQWSEENNLPHIYELEFKKMELFFMINQ